MLIERRMKFAGPDTPTARRAAACSSSRTARVDTPAFMPVGTYGTVKAMRPRSSTELGAQIVLGNTFHLWLRPGLEVIEQHGGLHRFMGWDGPILTDSGGFQVFSLGALRKISRGGRAVRLAGQRRSRCSSRPRSRCASSACSNSDIVMVFDECTPYPATREAGARFDAAVAALGGALEARARGQRERAVRHRAGRHVRGRCATSRSPG